MRTNPVLLSLGIMSLAFAAAYGEAPKVDVCHIPPGNPANFHTIRISENALDAHLAHGDVAGACNDACAELCDDGDSCTIDDTGDCEENGCPVVREPVDCSDGNLCTADLCDASAGCSNPTTVFCTPPDLCTTSTCDPLSGQCVSTPKVCPDGEECDLETGQCVPTAHCPCWTREELAGLRFPIAGDGVSCDKDFTSAPGIINRDFWTITSSSSSPVTYITTVFTQEDSNTFLVPGCFLRDECSDGSCLGAFRVIAPITAEEFAACEAQVAQSGAARGFSCFP